MLTSISTLSMQIYQPTCAYRENTSLIKLQQITLQIRTDRKINMLKETPK